MTDHMGDVTGEARRGQGAMEGQGRQRPELAEAAAGPGEQAREGGACCSEDFGP